MVVRIQVNHDILKWAILESDIPMDVVLKKKPIINKILYENISPTFNQIKEISQFLKVPFGFLFLEKPPQNEMFNAEFRTMNNKLSSKMSKNLKDTILEMDYRKSWMSEYKKINGYDKVNLPKLNTKDIKSNIDIIYNILNISYDTIKNESTSLKAFNLIRKKVEKLGILVMLNGSVGNDNHRKLDVREFRAFVLDDEYAPLIFINRNDTETGMLFSLLHEFIHLLLQEEGNNILLGYNEEANDESLINDIVAELLVPNSILIDNFSHINIKKDEINRLSRFFKTSPSVIAIKSYKLNLIDFDTKEEVIAESIYNYNRSKEKRETKGGNFYSNIQYRISKDFYTTVIHQAEGGLIDFKEAYKLLSLNGRTYDVFKKEIEHKLYE